MAPAPGSEPGAGFFAGMSAGLGKAAAGMSNGDIERVMNEHVSELMAVPGVTGVAVGALDDGSPCILVLVVARSETRRRRIPQTLGGYPVKIVVSGKIRPM